MSPSEQVSFAYNNETIEDVNKQEKYSRHSYSSKLQLHALQFQTTHELRYDDITSSQNYKETPKKLFNIAMRLSTQSIITS